MSDEKSALDIVERLRNDRYASWIAIVPMCMEAADEIERLRAECEGQRMLLREARELLDARRLHVTGWDDYYDDEDVIAYIEKLDAALANSARKDAE